MDCILLFYRRPVSGSGIPNQPGVAVTGRLDAAGTYTDLDTHTGFDFWSDIVPADTTSGRVLFYQPGLKTVGEVGTGGGYADVKNSTDAPSPFRFVSTRDGILIAYSRAGGGQSQVGIAQTWKLLPNGDFVALSEPRLLDPWVHIVPTVNGLVLFNLVENGTGLDLGRAATGLITQDGAFRDLKSLAGFEIWGHVVSTSDGILLFYNTTTGAAVTGKIDAEGNYADLQNVTLDRGWSHIVPTTNGLLLFYRATPGSAPEAVVGRINPSSGAYGDVALVKGLERWDKIVCVRALKTRKRSRRIPKRSRRKA